MFGARKCVSWKLGRRMARRATRTVAHRVAPLALVLSVAALGGCGRDDGSRSEVARVPKSAGVVWELDSAASRSAAPAALIAYVNGLHVLVIDGGDVYAGMTRLKAVSAPGGAWELRLSDGLTARLTPAGDAMELAFSSGERIGMRKRSHKEGD